jgi:hypothetical protein
MGTTSNLSALELKSLAILSCSGKTVRLADGGCYQPSSLFSFQMMIEMAWASWETVGRRSLMMACGKCSPAEYLFSVAETNHAPVLSKTCPRPGAGPY